MHQLKNKKVVVLGFARTGKSVANFLVNQHAQVILNDQSDLANNPDAQMLQDKGVQLIGGGHPLEILNQEIDFIVKNPGIPYHIDFLQAAIAKGIPIYTDIEIFSWFVPSSLVAITGSNGKTTTTSLAYHIFKAAGQPVKLAGNIGIPSLEIIETLTEHHTVMMELSSFQLMGTRDFHAHIAAITNIFPAHLDYHGNEEDYFEAKLKIIANQTSDDYVIVNAAQPQLVKAAQNGQAKLVPFTSGPSEEWIRREGLHIDQGIIYYREQSILPVDEVKIPGQHNLENIMVAIGIAKLMNLSNQEIAEGVRQFTGVEYRIQPLGTYRGVKIYNDSKATNPSATITALNSFREPIIYIGGGLDRGIDFQEMRSAIKSVQSAFVYGESKEKLAHLFKKENIDVWQGETLSEAIEAALQTAEEGQVVLFSPACASWDQYPNYEVRGKEFTDKVKAFFNQ